MITYTNYAVLSSGQSISGAVVGLYGDVSIDSGAAALSTTVQRGGVLSVAGVASDTTLLGEGIETVGDGGQADGVVVSSGGILIINAAQSSYEGSLPAGSAQYVTVLSGGVLIVPQGIVIPGLDLAAGAGEGFTAAVSVGQTVSGFLALWGGYQVVDSGGASVDATVNGAVQAVSGVASHTILESPTDAVVDPYYGYSASSLQYVGSTGVSFGTLISSGAEEDVVGTANGTRIAGGKMVVEAWGSAIGTLVQSGSLLDSGTISQTIIQSGGMVVVEPAYHPFQVENDPAGSAYGVVISSGGVLVVDSGALAIGVTVLSGGVISAQPDAVLSNVVLSAGAINDISPAAIWNPSGDSLVIPFGASQTLSSGAVDINPIIDGGTQIVYGTDSGAVVKGGRTAGGIPFGALYVVAPGVAIDTTVSSGGTLAVGYSPVPYSDDGNGLASQTVILAGGIAYNGAIMSGVTVSSGGLYAGGLFSEAYAVTISSGGSATFNGGGSGVILHSGGRLTVDDQYTGVVSGLVVEAGSIIDAPFASAVVPIDAANELLVMSGGQVIETISLAGPLVGLGYSISADGSGGTLIVFKSQIVSGLTGVVASATVGDQTYFNAFAPDWSLLAGEVVTESGGLPQAQYVDPTGALFAATLQQSAGGAIILQDFDGSWIQQGAVITTNLGGASIVQNFDASWSQTGATIVHSAVGQVITQAFDAGWTQTSATIVTDEGGGETITQYFDGRWRQTSAVVVHSSGADTLIQDFDSGWTMTRAEDVLQTDAGGASIRYFNALWQETGAETITASGSATTDQSFDSAGTLTGATVTTTVGSGAQLIQTYDANGNWLASEDRLRVQGLSALQVFADDPGVPTTYVFHPGEINGDAFAGFVNAGANPSAHDVLAFVGYGSTAKLTAIDATHWRITAEGLTPEVFTLAGGLNPAAGDVTFT